MCKIKVMTVFTDYLDEKIKLLDNLETFHITFVVDWWKDFPAVWTGFKKY